MNFLCFTETASQTTNLEDTALDEICRLIDQGASGEKQIRHVLKKINDKKLMAEAMKALIKGQCCSVLNHLPENFKEALISDPKPFFPSMCALFSLYPLADKNLQTSIEKLILEIFPLTRQFDVLMASPHFIDLANFSPSSVKEMMEIAAKTGSAYLIDKIISFIDTFHIPDDKTGWLNDALAMAGDLKSETFLAALFNSKGFQAKSEHLLIHATRKKGLSFAMQLLKILQRNEKGKSVLIPTELLYDFLTQPNLLPTDIKIKNILEAALEMKQIGHVWGLSGPMKITSAFHVDLHGSNHVIAFPYVTTTFTTLYPEFADQITALEKSMNKSPQEQADLIGKEEPVLIKGGRVGHTEYLLFTQQRLYYCNRGEGSEKRSGVTCYTIGQSKNILRVLKDIKTLSFTPEAAKYLDETILGVLDLQVDALNCCKQKPQAVGNCTVASAKSLCLALLIEEARKNARIKPEERVIQSQKKYKQFTLLLRWQAVHQATRSVRKLLPLLWVQAHKNEGMDVQDKEELLAHIALYADPKQQKYVIDLYLEEQRKHGGLQEAARATRLHRKLWTN